MPGPSKPLNSYLGPLVEDLNVGWNDRFVVKTHGDSEISLRIAAVKFYCGTLIIHIHLFLQVSLRTEPEGYISDKFSSTQASLLSRCTIVVDCVRVHSYCAFSAKMSHL